MARRKTRSIKRSVRRRTSRMTRRFRGRKRSDFIGKLITPAVALGTGIQQMVGEDIKIAVDQGVWANYTMQQKVDYVLHNIIGRVSGINYHPEFGGVTQTINPAGIINKWTGFGIGAIILSKVKIMPYKGTINKVGKGALIGGIVGGFFDPIPLQTPQYNAGIQTTNQNIQLVQTQTLYK